MELIIHILMLFIVINCSFKLSFWKLWQTVIYSLIAGLFVVGTWQYAILQSKTQIADYLQNTEALQNMAIIITLESALCFGYCVAFLRGLYGKKNLWWAELLRWYPSLLLFPVLFYYLTEAIFRLPGVDFSVTAWSLAGIVVITIPLLSRLMKYLVPEDDLRLRSFPRQLIHLYPRITDHSQRKNNLCCHRGGTQLESDYLVHRSVRCPVSYRIRLEQAKMAFITT